MKARKVHKIEVRQFLTRVAENPVPLRTMFGVIERETPKAIKVKLWGKPFPSSRCMRCGRKITNKISLYYSIGPECMSKMGLPPLESEEQYKEQYEQLKQTVGEITWEGWLPKSCITITPTDELNEEELERREVNEEVKEKPKQKDPVIEPSTELVNVLYKELDRYLHSLD